MSARKSSHRTIFLIVSSGSPLALIASSLRSISKKPVCPMTRSFHPPMVHCNQRVRFAATWREEFFEVPSREKVVSELNELKSLAQAKHAYGAAVSAVMGKAKLLNSIAERIEDVTKPDFNAAQSMQDIGKKLLQSVGFKEPDDVSIAAAIELNDTFIDGLQRIYQRAQGLTLEHRDS